MNKNPNKNPSKNLTTPTAGARPGARLGVVLVAASLALAGCGASADAAGTDVAGTGADAPAGEGVTLTDGWVKAADTGMSAAFGQLTNDGSQEVTVVSSATEASSAMELHETVGNETGEMVMREIEGGFVVPSGGTLDLEPGGNHLMLMDLTDPLEPGEEVTFTLTFADDSTYEFTVPVKDYSGANENYVGGDGMDMDMDAEMDMGAGSAGTDG